MALGALALLLLPRASGATTMVLRSSASFDSGASDAAWAVAAPSTTTVYAAGQTGGDFGVVRFDKQMVFRASAAFSTNGSGGAAAVAVDSAGNVYVTGSSGAVTITMVTAKFGPHLNFLSSASFSLGTQARARAIAVDGLNNVIVAGDAIVGVQNRFALVKYDSNLSQTASVSYTDGGLDIAYGVDTDASNNVIVTGHSQMGAAFNFLTLKYDPLLAGVVASHTLDYQGQVDQARAVTVHPSGQVYVAGKTSSDGVNFDVLLARYSPDLVLVSSRAYDAGGNDSAEGVGVGPSGEVLAGGESDAAGGRDFLALKFSQDLTLLSSATQNNGGVDSGRGVAVDALGNMLVAGESNDGPNPSNFGVLKFNGPPLSTGASRGQQSDDFQVLRAYGDNFIFGSQVSFSTSGITLNGAAPYSPEELGFNVTIDSVPLGRYDYTVTNPDASSCTVRQGLEIVYSKSVTVALGEALTVMGPSGTIGFTMPAGAWPSDFTLTLSSPSSIPEVELPLRASRVTLQATQLPDLGSAGSSSTIRIDYRPSDILTLDEANLKVGWYDPALLKWFPLPTVVDTFNKRVTATTGNLGLFAILSTLSDTGVGGNVRVYPNPYKPGSTGDFGDPPDGKGMVFTGLPPEFGLRIFSVIGEPVFSYSGASDLYGKYFWDTKNRNGRKCASGVYIYLVTDASGKLLKKSKFSIIR